MAKQNKNANNNNKQKDSRRGSEQRRRSPQRPDSTMSLPLRARTPAELRVAELIWRLAEAQNLEDKRYKNSKQYYNDKREVRIAVFGYDTHCKQQKQQQQEEEENEERSAERTSRSRKRRREDEKKKKRKNRRR